MDYQIYLLSAMLSFYYETKKEVEETEEPIEFEIDIDEVVEDIKSLSKTIEGKEEVDAKYFEVLRNDPNKSIQDANNSFNFLKELYTSCSDLLAYKYTEEERNMSKHQLIVGRVQSGKTDFVLKTAAYYNKHNVAVIVILRDFTDDLQQIMNRFRAQTQLFNLNSDVVTSDDIKGLDPTEISHFINDSRIMVAIDHFAHVTKIAEATDNGKYKYVLICDEADQLMYGESRAQSNTFAALQKIARNSMITFEVTATPLDNMILNHNLKGKNVFKLPESENYFGIDKCETQFLVETPVPVDENGVKQAVPITQKVQNQDDYFVHALYQDPPEPMVGGLSTRQIPFMWLVNNIRLLADQDTMKDYVYEHARRIERDATIIVSNGSGATIKSTELDFSKKSGFRAANIKRTLANELRVYLNDNGFKTKVNEVKNEIHIKDMKISEAYDLLKMFAYDLENPMVLAFFKNITTISGQCISRGLTPKCSDNEWILSEIIKITRSEFVVAEKQAIGRIFGNDKHKYRKTLVVLKESYDRCVQLDRSVENFVRLAKNKPETLVVDILRESKLKAERVPSDHYISKMKDTRNSFKTIIRNANRFRGATDDIDALDITLSSRTENDVVVDDKRDLTRLINTMKRHIRQHKDSVLMRILDLYRHSETVTREIFKRENIRLENFTSWNVNRHAVYKLLVKISNDTYIINPNVEMIFDWKNYQ